MNLHTSFARLALASMMLMSTTALATAPALTYHGRLLTSAGVPVAGSVQFKIQIVSPGTEACVLWEETQTQTLDSGVFALTINGADSTRTDGEGHTFAQAFSNFQPFVVGAPKCASGTTYTPVSGDPRVLKLSFNDGSGWEDAPAQAVNNAPTAIDALQVDGFPASSIMRVADGTTLGNFSPLSNAQYTEFLALVAGTSTQYAPASSNAGTMITSHSGAVTAPAVGSVWLDTTDNTLKYYTAAGTQTIEASGNGSIATAQLADGSVTTAKLADSSVTSAKIVDGTITGADLATNIVVSTTGTVSAAGIGTRAIALSNAQATPNSVTLSVPTAAFTNYALILPSATPAANQVLQISNATTGQLAWTNLSAGSVTSVSAAATAGNPVSVDNTTASAPKIDIAKADGTHNGYLSSTDFASFAAKLSTTLSAGTILVGNSTNVATAVTPSGDVTMTNTGAFTVTQLQGTPLASTTPLADQVLVYDGTASKWSPKNFSIGSLRTVTGSTQFAQASCSSAQTLTWSSLTDTFTCANISIAASAVTGLGTAAALNVGVGSNSVVQLDGSSRLPAVDASQLTGLNASAIASGTINAARLPTSASTWATNGSDISNTNSGNVGIGTSTPGSALDVNGALSLRAIAAPAVSPAGQGRIYFDSTSNTFKVSQNNGAYLTLATSGGSGGGQSSTSSLTFNSNSDNSGSDGGFSFQEAGSNVLTISNTGVVSVPATTASTSASSGALTVAGGLGVSGTLNAGVVAAANGTAAAPGLTFTSDLATGAYLPSSSTYAISTGGGERLRIDPSGRVGIGTTSPTARLTIAAGSVSAGTAPLKLAAGINLTTPEVGAVEFDGTNLYYTNSVGRQTLSTATGTGAQSFAGDVTMNGAGTGLTVTNNAAVGGNVAIGGSQTIAGDQTVTGSSTLTGGLTSAGQVAITNTTASTSTVTGALTVAGGVGVGGTMNIGGAVNAPLVNSNTILVNGSVGIGTTSQAAKLSIAAGTATIAPLQLTSGTNLTTPLSGAIEYDGTSLYYTDATSTRRTVASTSLVSGNYLPLGGGTMTGAVVHANGTAGAPSMSFANDPTTGFFSPSAGVVSIGTTASEQMRIAASGNVGIGTTAPSYKLDVAGLVNSSAGFSIAGVPISASGSSIWAASGANAYNTNSGGVGIGASAPTALLTLGAGTSGARSAPLKLTAGTNLTTPEAGAVEYDGTNLYYTDGTATRRTIASSTAASTVGSLSSLTAATAVNTIDSLNFAQTWNWSTATTQSPLTMNANALTTGSLLSLASSGASLNSTNGLLNVANTGASAAGLVARIQSNSTAGSGLTVFANGRVGIGTTAPTQALDVAGAVNASTGVITPKLYPSADGTNAVQITKADGSTNILTVDTTNSRVGIGTTAPTAALQIKAGTATAGTAPLKLTAGTNLTAPEAGAVEYDGTNLYYTDGTAARHTIASSTAASSVGALSSLTAATATNTIDSLNFAQTWNWSTATTQTPLTMNANTLTTGSVLSIASSNATLNSANGLLNVANTGASTTGTVARIQSNSTTGSGLTVLASGNVGIGTTSPQRALDIASTSAAAGLLRLQNTSSTGYSSTFFVDNLGATQGSAGYANTGAANYAGTVHFGSAASTSIPVTLIANGVEAIRIASGGNIGIGTTAPMAKLNIAAGTAAAGTAPLKLTAGTNLTAPEAGAVEFDGTNLYYTDGTATRRTIASSTATSTVGSLSSLTAATATNTIDSLNFAQTWNWSTSTTQTPLTINANALTTGSMLSLATSNATLNSTNGLLNVANTGASTTGMVARIQSNSTAGSGLSVLANGNVGIGTTNPSAMLVISGASGTQNLVVRDGTNSTYNEIQVASGNTDQVKMELQANSNSSVVRVGSRTNNNLQLVTNDTTRVTFDTSGNVGIATASPASRLSVNGGIAAGSYSTISAPTNGMIISGNVGIGTSAPSAALTLIAGTSAAGTAPLKLMAGSNLSTPESGAVEYDGTNLYYTDSTATRRTIASAAGGGSFLPLAGGTMTGALVHSNGTVAAPSLSFANDVTSGIYAPSAGVVGIGTSGVERMRILANGNIGIGTTSPFQALDINGNLRFANSTYNTIFFSSAGVAAPAANSVGEKVQLYGTGNASTSDFALGVESGNLWLNSSGGFKFYENGIAKVAIDSSGNVGIGTTSPAYKLDVNGTLNATGINLNGSALAADLWSTSSGNVYRSSGNVGIGTTSPASSMALDVEGNLLVQTGSYLNFANSNGNTAIGRSTAMGGMIFRANGTQAMIVQDGGNVGIGTTAPLSALSVNGGLAIGTTYAGTNAAGTNNLIVQGNVGIRNASVSNSVLGVNGDSANFGGVGSTMTLGVVPGYTFSNLESQGSSVGYGTVGQMSFVNTYNGSVASSAIRASSQNLSAGHSSGDLAFYTNDGTATAAGSDFQRMIINSSGNVGIGTTAPSAKLNITAGTATAGTAPLKFTAGTNLTTPEAGAIEYDGTNLYYTDSSAARHALLATGGSSSGALSGLTAATAVNTIDSLNFAQTWNWSTATTQTAHVMNANALTTGGLLTLSSSSASLNSTSGLLNVANTGASTNGMVARIQSNSTAGSGLSVLASGNVGIGTTSPGYALDVNGSVNAITSIIAPTHTSKTGANLTLIAGGGASNGATGMTATVQGGQGWGTSTGGAVTVIGGSAGGAGPGGAATLQGGSGFNQGDGGIAYVTGGAAAGPFNHNGGNVVITGGTAANSGIAGNIQLMSNVGIGTTAPAYKLDVNGTLNATGINLNGSALAADLWSTSSGNVYRSSGNVGIGTTAPGSLLTVNGSVATTGGQIASLIQSATDAATVNRSALTLQTLGTGSSKEFNIIGNRADGTTTFSVTQSGNVVGNNISGNSFVATATGASNAVNIGRASVTGIYFDGSNDMGFSNNSSTTMWLANGGNVGIGTTAPSAILSVNGSGALALPASSGSTQSSGLIARLQTASGTSTLDIGSGGSSGQWIQATNTGNLATVYPLLLNPTGGNVGIGTTAPAYRLDVAGDVNTSGVLRVAGVAINSGSANAWTQSGNSVYPTTGTAVGIGTTSPAYALDVNLGSTQSIRLLSNSGNTNGFINAAYSNFTFGNNIYYNGGWLYEKAGPASFVQTEGATGNIYFNTAPTGTAGATANYANRMIVANGGNVGIGTTSPAYKLDVNGTLNATGINLNGSALAADLWSTSSGNVYRSSGNVGIGTTAPMTNMDIVGTWRTGGVGPATATTLSANAAATDTSLTVASTTGYPTSGLLYLTTGAGAVEVVSYSGTTATTFTGLVRGLYGTSATAFVSGAATDLVTQVTAGSSTNTAPRFIATQTKGIGYGVVPPSYIGNAGAYYGGYLYSNSGIILTNGGVNYGTSSTTINGLGSSSASDYLAFTTNSTRQMTITGTGSVGIGTTAPSYALDVAGSVKSSSNIYFGTAISGVTSGAYIRGNSLTVAATPTYSFNDGVGTAGMFSPALGTVAFSTSGAEKLRIDTAGNVGIGTTSPASTLQIGSGQVLLPTGTGSAPALSFSSSTNTGLNYTAGPGLQAVVGGTGVLAMYANSWRFPVASVNLRDATTGNSVLSFAQNNAVGNSSSSSVLITGNASGSAPSISVKDEGASNESLSIAALGSGSVNFTNGNVGIGTTAPGYKLQVAGIIAPTGDGVNDLGASTNRFQNIYSANATVQTSDARQKKQIQDSDLGLDFITKLHAVSFLWKQGDQNLHYGVIAQETEKVLADAKRESGRSTEIDNVIVTHDKKTDAYGVRYTELIAPLIKAVQELYAQLVGHEAQLAAHDRDIASLKARAETAEKDSAAKTKELEMVKAYLCSKDPGAPICSKRDR